MSQRASRSGANIDLDLFSMRQDVNSDSVSAPVETRTGVQRGNRLIQIAWIAAGAYTAIALMIGLADLAFILRHYTSYPFGDHWIWLARYCNGGLYQALLTPYNEHRLFFPGFLYWIDLRFFGGKNTFLICASVIINVAGILVLALPLTRNREVPRQVRMTFFGSLVIAMLWYIQGPNFFYPFSLCLALANLGILTSFYFFTAFAERESFGKPHAGWLLTLSICCGFVGTFSYGHGILIWPLLLLNGFILRLRLRWIVPLVFATTVALALYFRHYVSVPGHGSALDALRSPLRVAAYFVMMLSLPWLGGEKAQVGLTANLFQYGITVSGLLISMFLIGIFVLRRNKTFPTVFYSSITMLALGSAAITALNRSTFPVSQSLSGRYAPIPLLFWISLFALITIHLCRYERSGGAGRALWCVGLAFITVTTLPTQFAMGQYMALRERSQDAAIASISIGAPDPAAYKAELYPAWNLLEFVDSREMRILHAPSVFQLPESTLLQTSLQAHFQITGDCDSTVDEARTYTEGQKTGVRLSGWVFDKRQVRSASKILVTDGRGAILGYGFGDVPRPDVAAAFGSQPMNTSGWIAYSQLPPDGSRQLRVFGEFPGSTKVCEVRSPKISSLQ